MNADTHLLLQSVLAETGCMDASLEQTMITAPFVYHLIAEQGYYVAYMTSAIKALLQSEESAYITIVSAIAHANEEEARRKKISALFAALQQPDRVVDLSTALPVAPQELRPVRPSSSLDMKITIIGGGACCGLLLRLFCGSHLHGKPLIHPSHLTVITRQPDRLQAYAQLGVHCLRRHHGHAALQSSDVVYLMSPPAQLKDVAATCFSACNPRTGLEEPVQLKKNAIVFSCMAGISKEKIAVAVRHELQLILCSEVDTLAQPMMLGTTEPSLPAAATLYSEAMQENASRRVEKMKYDASFLRPAVLQWMDIAEQHRRAGAEQWVIAAAPHSGRHRRERRRAGDVAPPPAMADYMESHADAARHSTVRFIQQVWTVMQTFVRTSLAIPSIRRGVPTLFTAAEDLPNQMEGQLISAFAFLPQEAVQRLHQQITAQFSRCNSTVSTSQGSSREMDPSTFESIAQFSKGEMDQLFLLAGSGVTQVYCSVSELRRDLLTQYQLILSESR